MALLALLFDLDIEVITAILGVVKMGKVYVALDPSSPRVRNDDILRELQANLILTNNRQQALAYELTDVGHAVLNVDEINLFSSDDIDLKISPFDLPTRCPCSSQRDSFGNCRNECF